MPELRNLSKIIQYRDTKTDIEALDASVEEISFAYATDTQEFGIRSNGAWVWFGGGAGQYRQFVYEVGSGDIVFLTDDDGYPLFNLLDVE
jgi:hypothetical protein